MLYKEILRRTCLYALYVKTDNLKYMQESQLFCKVKVHDLLQYTSISGKLKKELKLGMKSFK